MCRFKISEIPAFYQPSTFLCSFCITYMYQILYLYHRLKYSYENHVNLNSLSGLTPDDTGQWQSAADVHFTLVQAREKAEEEKYKYEF